MLPTTDHPSPEATSNASANPAAPRVIESLRTLATVCAAAVGLLGAAVLAGWLAGIPWLVRVTPDTSAMAANTALSFVFCGLAALILAGEQRSPTLRRTARGLAMAALVIGLLSIFQYLFDVNLGIDEILVTDRARLVLTASPGRMAALTAFMFCLTGAALWLLGAPRAPWYGTAQALATLAFVLSLTGAYGFSLAPEQLTMVAGYAGIAPATALAFLLLSAAIACIRADRGFMVTLAGPGAGGRLLRRLLPVAFFAPIPIAWLRLWGEHAGLYPAVFGIAIMAIGTTALFSLLLWWTARNLEDADAVRARIAGEVLATNAYNRGLIEANVDPMLVVDTTGRITDVNAAAEQVTGRPRTRLIGRTFSERFADPVAAEAWRKRVFSGDPVRDVPLEVLRADGSVTPVLYNAAPYRGGNGEIRGSIASLRDTTELLRARQAEQQAYARLRTLVDSDIVGVIVSGADGTITEANDYFLNLVGCSREELETGRISWRELTPPQWAWVDERSLEELRAHGRSTPYEKQYQRADGAQVWALLADVQLPGPGAQCISVVVDIDQRKQAETQTAQSEERFRRVADAVRGVVWDWNLNDGRCWWSEGLNTEFGHDPRSASLDPDFWQTHIDEGDREHVVESVRAFLEGHETTWSDEYGFRRADGTIARVSDRGAAIRDRSGRAVRMLGSLHDVSEQRELEEQLRQIQRLDVVGQLTGGIAHDFNNLLTVILGNAELLRDALRDDPGLLAMVELTSNAADRAAELTRHLLAFSRRQALEPMATDVDALVRRMHGLLDRTLGDHIDVEIGETPDLWPAMIDAGQLENAILNLCINARDAMPGGGKLTIALGNRRLDEAYVATHPGAHAGEYVELSVRDTGTGMEPDTAARAFEPFFTTKSVGEGTGLGLSMVYGFVTQSRGHVRLDTEPGRGTTVHLYLPRAYALSATQEDAESGSVQRGTGRILVVEDNDIVREHVCAQLRGLGYEIESATDAAQALEILARSDPFDLLFTDMMMPGGMYGLELTRRALELQPGLRVLCTSGYPENVLERSGQLDDGIRLLPKPYHRRQLATAVRQALAAASAAP